MDYPTIVVNMHPSDTCKNFPIGKKGKDFGSDGKSCGGTTEGGSGDRKLKGKASGSGSENGCNDEASSGASGKTSDRKL